MKELTISPLSIEFQVDIKRKDQPFRALIDESLPYTVEEERIIQSLTEWAPKVIGEVVEKVNDPTRQGGCLVIWKRDQRKPLSYFVGRVTKPDKYPLFAMAKAKLLKDHLTEADLSGENLLLESGEKYQFKFGDEMLDIPHGAVATENGWILSFSGFAQEWDASAMLALAVKSQIMGIDKADEIAKKAISPESNETIESCYKKLIPR
jgi:hypothetical protein